MKTYWIETQMVLDWPSKPNRGILRENILEAFKAEPRNFA